MLTPMTTTKKLALVDLDLQYIGGFKMPEEAARAYDAEVIRLGRSKRLLNFPDEHKGA